MRIPPYEFPTVVTFTEAESGRVLASGWAVGVGGEERRQQEMKS